MMITCSPYNRVSTTVCVLIKESNFMKSDSLNLPSYDDAADHLFWLSDTCSVSFLHGTLCAQICFAKPFDAKDWMQQQVEKNLNIRALNIPSQVIKQSEHLLQDLYEITEQQLNADDFTFQLLLPDIDEDLYTRTQALSEWCEGFVKELAVLCTDPSFYSQDAKEALEYLEDTINLDQEEIKHDEEHEKAFVDVLEYIRLGIILIYLETNRNQENISTPNKEVIH